MADESEAMTGQDDDRNNGDIMEVISAENINSTSDNVPDSQLIGSGNQSGDAVCDVSNNEIQSQRCTSSGVQITAENLSLNKISPSKGLHDASNCDINEPISINSHSNEHSDNESEIIVDDSPEPSINPTNSVESPDNDLSKDNHILDNSVNNPVRLIGRSRSVTPSPSYIRLATPSTPGTPRLRSGSVSGTTYAPLSPKPSPSARATPGERQRAGSMGEIEMREKILGREIKHGIRIIDNLDILQLPRPRNPGGILPMNGHTIFSGSNEALNLTLDDRQYTSRDSVSTNLVSTSFPSINQSSAISATASKRANTSYLISNIIRTTPNRQRSSNHLSTTQFNSLAGRNRGCAINESVERPLPSSIVDNEGVAKKIARLNSEGFLCTGSVDNLWGTSGTGESNGDHISRVRVISDKTPPERPKPPRRTVLSPGDNGSDVVITQSDRSFIPSGVRRRLSPAHIYPVNHRESTPSNGHTSGGIYTTSPDEDICHLPHHYKCRICNYTSTSYNMLQLHTTKHGGTKTFKCTLCDYTTQEKSNFRKHRRLHHKTSPVHVLRCVKCSFVTSISRKLRDHYHNIHPEFSDIAQHSGIGANRPSPQRLINSHGLSADSTSVYHGHYYDSPMIMSRNRLGYPYTMSGRQAPLNYPLDHYDMTYSSFRDHHGDNMSSDYLRTIGGTRRQPATSTVTSSSYYMSSGMENSPSIQNVHTCNNEGTCDYNNCTSVHSDIKIKVENDVDNASDVSSTANSSNLLTPDITRNLLDNSSTHVPTAVPSLSSTIQNGTSDPSIHLQPFPRHRNAEGAISQNPNHEFPTDLTSPRKNRAISDLNTSGVSRDRIELDLSNEIHPDTNFIKSPPPSNTIIKSDSTTRGIQCVLPVIKTELDLDGDYYDFFGRPRFHGVDRAVQCNLHHSSMTATNPRSQCATSRTTFRSQSVSESELSEHHSSVCGESRCDFCGITFDDEVLYSIHLGCHSHTEPFKCNVCGKQCGNKYGFYSHIMRGHQA
ncbi:hypothetical protein ACF0H5_008943 [Mactra antiquata]